MAPMWCSPAISKNFVRVLFTMAPMLPSIPSTNALKASKNGDDGAIIDFRHLVTSQKFKTAPSARLYPHTKNIITCDITDMNWTNGIWTNTETPGLYSFTYQSELGGEVLKAGDKLIFNRSGVRAVLRVDLAGNYINVLVDGGPLHKQDGSPHPIIRHHDK